MAPVKCRLEVLQANTSAVKWYQRRGFKILGETANATGQPGIASYYMDRERRVTAPNATQPVPFHMPG